MKYAFGIVYFIYFLVQSFYTQADFLSEESLEVWGKIWFTSHDTMTMFLAIGLGLGWYDPILRKMAVVGAVYQFLRIIFDICWLGGWASTDSLWWTASFFMVIFVMNFILFSNGRYTKR